MSPKLSRLLFVALVVTGVSAPMLGAYAAPEDRTVDAHNMPKGFSAPAAQPANRLEINVNDTVSWVIWEGEHTITPKDAKQWGDSGSTDTLKQDSPRYTAKNFKTPGDYVYYCKLHGGLDNGNPTGMWGVIHVIDPAPPAAQPPPATQPPATQPAPPSTTAPTRPSATPPATTATVPTTRPTPTTAAPNTTTTKGDKDKKGNKDETTTSTIPPLTPPPPPPPPIDLPDEAIVPHLPGPGSTVQGGVEDPGSAAEGEAVALLTTGKGGSGTAKTLLIVSGLGLGVLGLGTAGYKWANRSSKYFPA